MFALITIPTHFSFIIQVMNGSRHKRYIFSHQIWATSALLLAISLSCAGAMMGLSSSSALADGSFILSNPVLKRRLEINHKMAYVDLAPELSYVFLPVPVQSRGIDVVFLLGIYKPVKGQAPVVPEEKKGGFLGFGKKLTPDESKIKETRKSAEALIMGTARDNLQVTDEFNAPPALEGQTGPIKKISPADALLIEGFDLIAKSKFEDAETKIKKAIEQAPNSIKARNNLACLMAMDGRYKEAEELFNSLIPKTVPNGPRCCLPSINLANLYCLAQNYDDALKTLYGFEEDSPEGKALPLRLALIRVLLLKDMREKAKDVLNISRKEFPANLTLMELAGDVAIEEKNYRIAIDLLTPVAGKDAVDPIALLKIADAYNRLGDLDTAIKKATLATNNFPDDPNAHIALGKYYLANKEFLGAKLQFERTMELNPPLAIKKTMFVPYLKTLDAMNNYKGMQDVTSSWCKSYPKQSICHFNRAWALEMCAKTAKEPKEGEKLSEEAITEYEKAVDLEPSNLSANYNLALILKKNKRRDEAIKRLRAFLDVCTSDADHKDAEGLLKALESTALDSK
jgi:tetratricopeptide (TPR) repeat protein